MALPICSDYRPVPLTTHYETYDDSLKRYDLIEQEKINKPVVLWQGNDDFMVPQAHSEWLHKHIPTSTLNFVPGHGHISLIEKYRENIIEMALGYLN